MSSAALPVSPQNYNSVAAAINKGISTVEAHTPADVKKYLDGKVLSVAKANPHFTTDDVHKAISDDVKRPKVISPSAIGPALIRARKAGHIRETSLMRTSSRPSRHGNKLPVWRSNFTKIDGWED